MLPRTTRLSAGVVVIRETHEGWLYLLLRAYNHWDFPKGMVEPGEEPLAAAIREVRAGGHVPTLLARCAARDKPNMRHERRERDRQA